MSVLLGVDIGGTFTDIVSSDLATGRVTYAKTTTFPSDLVRSLREAMAAVDVSGDQVGVLRHGTTVVINAILTRSGGRTALVTTRGFRDVLEIGRTNWPEPYNLLFDRLPPLVPRELRFEVDERLAADGSVVTRLDDASLAAVIEQLRAAEVQSVAVCLLHSYADSEHERRVAAAITEALPDVYLSMSHELSKEFREYERTSTTAVNAYVGGVVDGYLVELQKHLAGQGFAGTLYLMESNGGVTTAASARRRPIVLVESGPAAGVMATAAISTRLGVDRAIAFDMGGTTAKACLVEHGEALFTSQYHVPDYEHGYPIQVAALDLLEVGTGGGSIAAVDGVGQLSVGPRSAGAVPGPACYGAGGTEATVTDANLVLGRLDPQRFLGGELVLDTAAAHAALDRLAGRLGCDREAAAVGVVRLANFTMAAAIRRISLERGRDPREFVLVAYGGAGPLHAVDLARELAVPRVVVPVMPGIFSALGMLLAEVRQDFTRTVMRDLAELDDTALAAEFATMDAEAAEWERTEGGNAEGTGRRTLRYADCRYRGQEFTIMVGVPDGGGSVRDRFEQEYRLRYGHAFPELTVEVVTLRAVVHLALPRPDLAALPLSARAGDDSAARSRPVYFAGAGHVETPVLPRAALRVAEVLTGPLVVEEYGSTTVVGPGDRLTVDELGQLVIDLRTEQA